MFFEQPKRERAPRIRHRARARRPDIEVERPLWREHGECGRGLQDRERGVTARAELRHHRPHGPLHRVTERERRERCVLRDRGRVGGGVGLECRHRLGDGRGRDRPSDPPSRHRIRLGHAIHDDQVVAAFRGVERARRDAIVGDPHVDLVTDHPPTARGGEFEERMQLVAGVDRAGGIARGVQHQSARARGRMPTQVLRVHLESARGVAVHFHRGRARQPHHLEIARPARRRDEHLVPGTEEHHAGVEQGLLGPRRDHDLGRRDAIRALP